MIERLVEWIATRFFKLTGGRPMIEEGYAFTDVVSGEGVYYFRDRMGRKWLANGPWFGLRVKRGDSENVDIRLWTWKRDR